MRLLFTLLALSGCAETLPDPTGLAPDADGGDDPVRDSASAPAAEEAWWDADPDQLPVSGEPCVPMDAYEPNDDQPTGLGHLADPDEVLLFGYAYPEGDVDRFRFHVSDSASSWFSLEAAVHGVAPDVDIRLELEWTADANGNYRGIVATADLGGAGIYEWLDHGGEAFLDDDGWYELRIRTVRGESCDAPYTLQILMGGV